MAGDKLCVVEAAYRLRRDEQRWLADLAEAVATQLPDAVSPHAFLARRVGSGPPSFERAYVRGVDDALEHLSVACGAMSSAQLRMFFGAGIVAGTFSERIDIEAPGGGELVFRSARQRGGEDIYGVAAVDPFGHAIALGAVISVRRTTTPSERTAWERIAVHAATALRLRASGVDRLLERCSAVLSPDGSLREATGDAAEPEVRRRLSDAARDVERARLRRSALSEDERLELWQGLVEGRWSIVDHEDADGRRHYLAVENPPRAVGLRRLSQRERQVVAFALCGAAHKIAGYALGIGEGAVAHHLRQAMRKLGVPDRMALIQLARGLGAGDPAGLS